MLFEYNSDTLESDKERNLYYKFFAGYFFNEMIPGIEARLLSFLEVINNKPDHVINTHLKKTVILKPDSTHVTFDAHAYLLEKETDRGELADILLVDRISKSIVAIEAKFLSDWNVKKDIRSNASRIRSISDSRNLASTQCLLVPKQKWIEAKRQYKKETSNYSLLQKVSDIYMVIIFWETLIDLCENEQIKQYFQTQVQRTKRDFRSFNL